MAELVDSGAARAGEVAVLLRALGDVEVYERALQLCGLRTLAMVGGFWGRLQTRDLLAYLRALANPLDEQALYDDARLAARRSLQRRACAARARRARGRAGGVGDGRGDRGLRARARRCARARARRRGPSGRPPEAERAALARFCEHFGDARAHASRRSISRLIEGVIDACGYREHVLSLEWGERRLANIHKLLRLARRFEASEGRDLRGFLDHVERLGEAAGASEPDAPVDSVEPDAVRLMTIHAAKGLEFPVVCVADLGRQPNLRVPRLLVDGERIGLQLLRLDGEPASACLDYEELCEERKRAQAEEEERIVYVAMTRARERLLLSGAVDFERWPAPGPAAATISWLAPALAPDLPAALAEPPAGGSRAAPRGRGGRGDGALCARHTVDDRLHPAARSRRGRRRAPRRRRGIDRRGGAGAGCRRAHRRPPTASRAAAAARDAVLHRTERARALRLPLLPGTRARPARGSRCGRRRGGRSSRRRRRDSRRGPAGRSCTGCSSLWTSRDHARPTAEEVARVRASSGCAWGRRSARSSRRSLGAAVARGARGAGGRRAQRAPRASLRVLARDGGALITGVIDLLACEADGRWLVLDYKSDRVSPGSDLGALVERDYAIQRELYALAVLRTGAAEVEIVHWFLQRPGEPVAARYPASRRGELEGLVAARIEHVGARGYSVSRAPHRGLCLTCPGRAALCSWGEERTLGEDRPAAAVERAREAAIGEAPGLP